MKRLQLGLTDFERNRLEQARRARNCIIALVAVGFGGSALIHWLF